MPTGQVFGGGGQRYQGVQAAVPDRSDATANLLLKIGDGYLQRKLGEEQQNQFVKGMQKVAVGEAYQDIRAGDNPVLSDVFGPSATVQGAAAMAKIQGVEDFTSKAYGDMEGNASMSPGQFRERMVADMSKHLTGDPTVDNVVQTKMVENLGPLMKAQAKANYGYIQKQAEIGFNGMVSSAADKLHNVKLQAAAGTLSAGDSQLAEGDFLRSMQPVAGMNEDTYRKSILGTAVNQMARGNLWADKVLRTNGFYDGLTPEDQAKLETARNSAESRTKQEFGFNKYGPQIGEIMGGAANRSPAATMQLMNKLDGMYRAETGSDMGLFDTKDAVQVNSMFYRRANSLADKRTEQNYKANLDAQAEGRLAMQTAEGAMLGKVGSMYGVPKEKQDQAFNAVFTGLLAKDPGMALDMATRNFTDSGYVNDQLKNMLTVPFRQVEQGMVPGPEFDRSIQFLDKWVGQQSSGGSISAYLGADDEARLSSYRNGLSAGLSKPDAARAAFGSAIIKGPSVNTPDVLSVMNSAIEEKQKGGSGVMATISNWIKGVPQLDDGGKQVVANAIAKDTQSYINNLRLDPKVAAMKALEGGARRSVDIIGRYAYAKRPDQDPLSAMASVDDEALAVEMPKFMQGLARNQGIAANLPGGGSASGRATSWTNDTDLTGMFGGGKVDVQLSRDVDGKDKDGKPYAVFHGIMQDKDTGKSAQIVFTSNDVRKHMEAVLRSNVGKKQPTVPVSAADMKLSD